MSEGLLEKLNAAVKAANEAEQNVATAQGELVSRSKEVGLLLLEAKKLHPVVRDFQAFLKKVKGLELSRAYDLLRLAGGRTTDEELKRDARERKQRSRAKKKSLPKPAKEPAVTKTPLSVTVTEKGDSAAESAERRKAENAAADDSAEVRWQRALECMAGDAISLRAYWREEFGDWEKFKAPSDLITLAKQATDEWAAIASQLDLSIPPFLRRDEAA